MLEQSKFALSLRWRPMEPGDVRDCAQIIATHPTIGPRYGGGIDHLRRAWQLLLGSAAMTTAVFEFADRKQWTILGVGVGVFVSDEFIRELKTAPLMWFGPELARRVANGSSPVLSDRQVREANSGEGLNELVWETLARPEHARRTEVFHLMGRAYIEIHRGFLFREMITAQAESAERLQWAVDAGGLYWNPVRRCYEKSPPEPLEELAARPHVVGITRELEFARPGSWVGALFDYRPPRFGFTRAEQQLLLVTLGSVSGTDREIAAALAVSVPTVKKTWSSIYRRVAAFNPELVPDAAIASRQVERGPEKKRRAPGRVCG
jgi:DNA-binding CsgD family transcriptional regulator